MYYDIYDTYPPSLAPDQKEYLVRTVSDWCIQHGLSVRPSPTFVSEEVNPHRVLATNAPVTLFPSPFPKSCFQHAQQLQQVYNELYATIADDEEWLETILKEYVTFQNLLVTCSSANFQLDDSIGKPCCVFSNIVVQLICAAPSKLICYFLG